MSNYKGGVLNRRKRALSRMEAQLASGVKPGKRDEVDEGEWYLLKLSDVDVKRIKKEMETLKSKT